jgi:hypothetical protein
MLRALILWKGATRDTSSARGAMDSDKATIARRVQEHRPLRRRLAKQERAQETLADSGASCAV